MSEELGFPRWVIRRYAVVKGQKVDKFETLPGAIAHGRKYGGEVRELVFRLSEVNTVEPGVEGWPKANGVPSPHPG